MCQFIESIRIENGKIHLLPLHQKRMNGVFENFKSTPFLDLEQLTRQLSIPKKGLYKWRIEYDLEGNFHQEIILYNKLIINNFKLINCDDIDYKFKYKNRQTFLDLKQNSAPHEPIILQKGNITDTTFSNLIFLRKNHWYTPTTYLLNGVMRQFLLNEKQISETEIHQENLSDFEGFQLINAMRPPENEFYTMDQILPILSL